MLSEIMQEHHRTPAHPYALNVSKLAISMVDLRHVTIMITFVLMLTPRPSLAPFPQLRQALGVSHVRGLLLHGPPGCGKTLLARELSRRLGARPPKLVSGPEILDKWVGEAERKVRLLFLDAEVEHERCDAPRRVPYFLPFCTVLVGKTLSSCI